MWGATPTRSPRGIYTTASRARALLVVVGAPHALERIGLEALAARFG